MLTPGGSLLPCAPCPCIRHICDGTCRVSYCGFHEGPGAELIEVWWRSGARTCGMT